MSELLLATANPGKQREFSRLLQDLPGRLVLPQQIGLTLDVPEPHLTYAENAAAKADAYSRASGLLTLADDSGIEVAALDWGPGVTTARFGGADVPDRVALLLSAVGLYSVMAYIVSQRTREVGIRMALGARRADVLKLITSEGMKLAAIGVVIGFALSLALSRVLSSVLIGVSAYDVTTFILVPLLLAVVAFVACLVPARRATKVNPLVALRYE